MHFVLDENYQKMTKIFLKINSHLYSKRGFKRVKENERQLERIASTLIKKMYTKSHHKTRRVKKFSSCTNNGIFFSATSCKEKDTIFGATRKNFSPSYLVTALIYREFLPNANFITANFITAVFQNYY